MAGTRGSTPLTFFRRAVQAAATTISSVSSSTWFGPGQPLAPMAPSDVKGRAFDYPFATNLQYLPRSTEAIGFPTLKRFSNQCDILRIVIETRKDQMEAMEWGIMPRSSQKGKRPAESKFKGQIETFTELFKTPDRRHDWSQWLRGVNEQLYVYDAVSIEPVTTRGGDLYSLELVDGATISPKIGADGRTPMPPDPAYQQILKGVPAVNYTSQELIYYPKNVRVDHVYGYSRVEQIFHYVEMALARVQQQIDFFGVGNMPDGLIEGPTSMSADQLKSWQVYWDALFEGNIAQRRHAWWVPAGTKFTPTKTDPAQDTFDEWLARIICYCFSTSPQPLLKMMNRATAQSAQEEAEAEGLRPDMQYIARLCNRIIQSPMMGNCPDLEFIWDEDTEFDPVKKATIDSIYVRNAIKCVDEVRDELGLDPFGDWASEPRYATANGLVDPSVPPPPPVTPGQPQLGGPSNGNQGSGSTAPNPAQSGGVPKPKEAPKSGASDDAKDDDAKKGTIEVPLLITRPLLNVHDLQTWADQNGITLQDGTHVTVAYSRNPVDPRMLPEAPATVAVDGGARKLETFDMGAIVLTFESSDLQDRWNELAGYGLTWDYDDYKPHITLVSADDSDQGFDLSSVEPYAGPLLFGPEEFETLDNLGQQKENVAKMSYDELTEAANEAATPSPAQASAGNYKMGHVNVQGLDISIENPKGSTRSGASTDGTKWSSTLAAHYGYIKRTMGADGDHVDCFLGTNPDSQKVWVIDQVLSGKFDEHKCFVGYDSWIDALSDYVHSYGNVDATHQIGGITQMSVADFKDWLGNGDTTKPLTALKHVNGPGGAYPGATFATSYQNNASPPQTPWPINGPGWNPKRGVGKRSGPQVGDRVRVDTDVGNVDNAPWGPSTVLDADGWRVRVEYDDGARWYDLNPEDVASTKPGQDGEVTWHFSKREVGKHSHAPFRQGGRPNPEWQRY